MDAADGLKTDRVNPVLYLGNATWNPPDDDFPVPSLASVGPPNPDSRKNPGFPPLPGAAIFVESGYVQAKPLKDRESG